MPCRRDKVAIAVALADKLDTLTGFFAIGEKPTGSGDPFALAACRAWAVDPHSCSENKLSSFASSANACAEYSRDELLMLSLPTA